MRTVTILSFLLLTWLGGFYYAHAFYTVKFWDSSNHSFNSEDYSFFTLFSNNLLMVVKNIGSCFMLGVPAIINVFLNGYVFGNYLEKSSLIIDSNNILLMSLPHAPFELPALFLSADISIEGALILLSYLIGHTNTSKIEVIRLAKLSGIDVFLIFLGAIVEYLTINRG